jgi:hypothetical protein
MSPAFSTAQILERLEILWRKMEDEGAYVSANTVTLAIEEIKRLRVFDGAGLWDEYGNIIEDDAQ